MEFMHQVAPDDDVQVGKATMREYETQPVGGIPECGLAEIPAPTRPLVVAARTLACLLVLTLGMTLDVPKT